MSVDGPSAAEPWKTNYCSSYIVDESHGHVIGEKKKVGCRKECTLSPLRGSSKTGKAGVV